MEVPRNQSNTPNPGLAGEKVDSDDWIERLALIARHTSNFVIFTDKDGKITSVNEPFLRRTGYQLEEVIGKKPSFFHGHNTDPAAVEQMEAALAKGSGFRGELLNYTKSGTPYWIDVEGIPLKSDKESLPDFLWIETETTVYHDLEVELTNLRMAVDQSANTVVITDVEGNIEYVNPSFEKCTGYSAAEVLGKNTRILKSGQQPLDFYRELWDSLRSGATWKGQFQNRRKDGTFFFESATISPVTDSSGKVVRFIAVKEDVTQRMAAEEAFKKEHRRLIDLLNGATEVSIITVDKEGLITMFSHGAEILLGYKQEELVGLVRVDSLHLPSEIEARARELSEKTGKTVSGFEAVVANALRSESEAGNWTYVRKDGSKVPVSLVITTLRDPEGAVCGFLGIATNISDMQSSKAALLASEQRFTSAFHHAAVGMALVSPEGTFLRVNRALCKFFGFTESELMGRNFRELTFPEDLASDLERVEKVLSGKMNSYQMEKRYFHKSGKILHAWLSVSLVRSSSGEPVCFNSQIIDLTERKMLENDLVDARNRAESASVAKSRFLANMSHEIRTPLNGVMGFSSLLLETPLSPDQRELCESAHKSAEILLSVLNDILDFSKIEAGRIDLEEKEFSLRQAIQDCVILVTPSAAEKKLPLQFEVSPDCPETILGDVIRFRQVLTNLLANAIKFTEKGRVDVHADLEKLKLSSGTCLRIQVSDTGIGISPAQQQNLFQPFSQGDTSTTRRFGGTGLGLVISRRLVELMGGKMDLESSPGEGSKFSFTLPLSQSSPIQNKRKSQRPRGKIPQKKTVPEPAEETVALDTSSFPSHSMDSSLDLPPSLRILLVEDSVSNQKVFLLMLKHLGYRADLALNGAEAVQAVHSRPYDVILMDIQMPAMDGHQATRAIRHSIRKDRQPWIIAITAHAAEFDRDLCISAGMDDYLSKPVRRSLLKEALRKASAEIGLCEGR